MSRTDRLTAISLIVVVAALLLLTELRAWWARPDAGWYAPWVLWTALVAAGVAVSRLAPTDDG